MRYAAIVHNGSVLVILSNEQVMYAIFICYDADFKCDLFVALNI